MIEVTPSTFQEIQEKLALNRTDAGDLALPNNTVLRMVAEMEPKRCPRCKSLELRYSHLGYDCQHCSLFFEEKDIGANMDRRK